MLLLALLVPLLMAYQHAWEKDHRTWELKEAIRVLNDSPWATHQTATRIVGGIGSGVAGEKEIYQRFYVRFLSARPIRAAYARVGELIGNDRSQAQDKQEAGSIDLDTSGWIVLAVAFRSNDAAMEQEVKRVLQTQTTQTMKTRAFLSTARFPQLEIAAYFPPLEDSVGARFVFPRQIGGHPVVSPDDKNLVFELEMPSGIPSIRRTFKVREMIVGGELIL